MATAAVQVEIISPSCAGSDEELHLHMLRFRPKPGYFTEIRIHDLPVPPPKKPAAAGSPPLRPCPRALCCLRPPPCVVAPGWRWERSVPLPTSWGPGSGAGGQDPALWPQRTPDPLRSDSCQARLSALAGRGQLWPKSHLGGLSGTGWSSAALVSTPPSPSRAELSRAGTASLSVESEKRGGERREWRRGRKMSGRRNERNEREGTRDKEEGGSDGCGRGAELGPQRPEQAHRQAKSHVQAGPEEGDVDPLIAVPHPTSPPRRRCPDTAHPQLLPDQGRREASAVPSTRESPALPGAGRGGRGTPTGPCGTQWPFSGTWEPGRPSLRPATKDHM